MDELQARIIADRIAARVQEWLIDVLKDDPVAQRVEAVTKVSGDQACPFDGDGASLPPAPDHLSPESLVPKSWTADLEEIFGVAGVDSVVLREIGLCIRRTSEAATNYAIGEALKVETMRGRRALKWIWRVAENWTPQDKPSTNKRKKLKEITLRPDAVRNTLERDAGEVF